MPISKETKRPKGFAYITFTLPEHAVRAHKELDMKNFQGRLMHILPSKEKPQQKEEDILGPNGMKMSKYKQQKELDRKKNAGSDFNWNSLYMSVCIHCFLCCQKLKSSYIISVLKLIEITNIFYLFTHRAMLLQNLFLIVWVLTKLPCLMLMQIIWLFDLLWQKQKL